MLRRGLGSPRIHLFLGTWPWAGSQTLLSSRDNAFLVGILKGLNNAHICEVCIDNAPQRLIPY